MKQTKAKEEFYRWFDKNMIYCEDTHSFVHRLFDLREKWKSHKDAQNDAWAVLGQMRNEFEEKHK
jgi:hypothetical protein